MADVCLETHTATKNFFEISRRIKQKLGNKSYKLYEYLELILKIVNIPLTADAAEDGRKYFSQLMSLCRGILDYNLNVKEHEFYKTAKEFMVTHKFHYKGNNTLLELYCVLLTPKFTDFYLRKFTENIKRRLRQEIDTVLVFQYSKLIINTLGGEEMVALNNAITGRLIISSIQDSFLQAITNEYFILLAISRSRDIKTNIPIDNGGFLLWTLKQNFREFMLCMVCLTI